MWEIKEKILYKKSPLYQNNNGFCGHFRTEYLFDVQVLHSITSNKDLYQIGCRERERRGTIKTRPVARSEYIYLVKWRPFSNCFKVPTIEGRNMKWSFSIWDFHIINSECFEWFDCQIFPTYLSGRFNYEIWAILKIMFSWLILK